MLYGINIERCYTGGIYSIRTGTKNEGNVVMFQ